MTLTLSAPGGSECWKKTLMTRQYIREEYPLSEVTARIIKAAQGVHQELGPGFEEVIYQRALALEFPAHPILP